MPPKFDFQKTIDRAAQIVSDRFDVDLAVDARIVSEIEAFCEKSLASFNQDDPSAAKIAGSMVFWIRKLKPAAHTGSGYFPSANEYIAILCGVALVNSHWREKKMHMQIRKEALIDFSRTLRFHSHSPHGLALMFEMFMCASAVLN